jgi:uncharacterized protein (TIGR02594 family)
VTPFEVAKLFIGARELPGGQDNPLIQWFLSNVGMGWGQHDEVPWCSAFVSSIAMMLKLPRSTSAAARSWLTVGQPVPLAEAIAGNDIVILKRGTGVQPGPEVLKAQGHVGLFAGRDGDRVLVLAGNQSNSVNVTAFPAEQVLGVRRLAA